jgi:hypothetical protein
VGSAGVNVNDDFDVPVTITGASDLYAYQFDLTFDPNVLQLLSIDEGSFLGTAGSTFFIPGTIDNVLGSATFTADSLLGPGPGAVGSGTLATFNFQAVAGDITALDLANVVLLNSNLNDIGFMTAGGTVTVQSAVAAAPEPGLTCLIGLIISAMIGRSKLTRRRPPLV